LKILDQEGPLNQRHAFIECIRRNESRFDSSYTCIYIFKYIYIFL